MVFEEMSCKNSGLCCNKLSTSFSRLSQSISLWGLSLINSYLFCGSDNIMQPLWQASKNLNVSRLAEPQGTSAILEFLNMFEYTLPLNPLFHPE